MGPSAFFGVSHLVMTDDVYSPDDNNGPKWDLSHVLGSITAPPLKKAKKFHAGIPTTMWFFFSLPQRRGLMELGQD